MPDELQQILEQIRERVQRHLAAAMQVSLGEAFERQAYRHRPWLHDVDHQIVISYTPDDEVVHIDITVYPGVQMEYVPIKVMVTP